MSAETRKIEHVLCNCECRHAQTAHEAMGELKALQAQLAKVPAFVEALHSVRATLRGCLSDDAISRRIDFTTEIDELDAALAAFEQEQVEQKQPHGVIAQPFGSEFLRPGEKID